MLLSQRLHLLPARSLHSGTRVNDDGCKQLCCFVNAYFFSGDEEGETSNEDGAEESAQEGEDTEADEHSQEGELEAEEEPDGEEEPAEHVEAAGAAQVELR